MKFECSYCHQEYDHPKAKPGQKAKCKQCYQIFVIPQPEIHVDQTTPQIVDSLVSKKPRPFQKKIIFFVSIIIFSFIILAVFIINNEIENKKRKLKDAANAQLAFSKNLIAAVGLDGIGEIDKYAEEVKTIAANTGTTTDKVLSFLKAYKEARPESTHEEIIAATAEGVKVSLILDMSLLGELSGRIGQAMKLSPKQSVNTALVLSKHAQGRERAFIEASNSLMILVGAGMDKETALASIMSLIQKGYNQKQIDSYVDMLITPVPKAEK
jgi:hypothetical protein